MVGQHALTHDPRDPTKKWPIWPTDDPWPLDPLPALDWSTHYDNDASFSENPVNIHVNLILLSYISPTNSMGLEVSDVEDL